jgi:tripartite-type tricarboxylate transporter receptor subunit TctC
MWTPDPAVPHRFSLNDERNIMMSRKFAAIGTTTVLALALTACADRGGSTESSAEGDFEFGDLTLIVGYGPGSGTDAGARLMAAELEERLGVTITVKNQEGAGGQVGLTALANAECSGNTFGTINFPSAIVSVLDPERGATYTRESFAPVALMVIDPTAVAVLPDDEIESPEDLVAAAEANPGELQYTTTGVASQEHFAAISLEEEIGTKLAPVHFPEGGGAVKTTFLGGDVRVFIANVGDMMDLVENEQARVIGVMEEERSPLLPDVPTFTESGVDVSMSSSRGFAYPECAPEEAVNSLSETIGEVMEDEEFLAKMDAAGLAPAYRNAEEYTAYWNERDEDFTKIFGLAFEE